VKVIRHLKGPSLSPGGSCLLSRLVIRYEA
jgi:hypothetical protein